MSKARLAIVGVLVTVDGRIGKQPAIIPSRRVYVYGKNWPCFLWAHDMVCANNLGLFPRGG